MSQSLIIFPTYNECENIENIIAAVLELNKDVHILVVDDGSPDGTGDIVKKLSEKNPQVHLLSNSGKGGLGKAYLQGFGWGLKNGYEYLVQMDADFSHRPIDLGKLLIALKENDLVIGSRYVPGGDTANWAWYRKFISLFGSFYSRMILGYPLRDWTGGFNGWTAKRLQSMALTDVRSEGYSFQIEMKYRALKGGAQVQEVPIIFDERREGQSKMSLRIVLEAFYRVWQIRFIA